MILNFQPSGEGGEYLAACEDDTSQKDGELVLLSPEDVIRCRMVGFIERNTTGFMESHEEPSRAPSDGPNMIPLDQMEGLLSNLKRFDEIAKENAYMDIQSD